MGVALIPVTIKDANYFEKGAKVLFKLSDTSNSLIGVVQMKQPIMNIVNGQQCIFVMATVYNLSENFISGVFSEIEIDCGRIPFLNFIERTILY